MNELNNTLMSTAIGAEVTGYVLAAHDEEEARAAYFDFLDSNLSGMSFEIKN